jgi:hypothetical protein
MNTGEELHCISWTGNDISYPGTKLHTWVWNFYTQVKNFVPLLLKGKMIVNAIGFYLIADSSLKIWKFVLCKTSIFSSLFVFM